MTITRYEEIHAWQEARILVREVYQITKDDLFAKDYGLKDQIRRAAVSAMTNIVEGFSRRSDKDFARFLMIASASASEVSSLLYVALDQEYVSDQAFKKLYDHSFKVGAMINGFAKYLRSSEK